MSVNELDKLIKDIVVLATELKNKFTHEVSAPVNYACIFAQKQEEYEDLIRAAARLGTVIMRAKLFGSIIRRRPPMNASFSDCVIMRSRDISA